MKKYLILLAVWLFCWGNSFAQQRPQFTQYFMSPYLQNPALTGVYDYTDLRAGFRNQWTGFPDAPQSTFVSGHLRLRQKRQPLPTIGTFQYTENTEKFRSKFRHGVGGHLIYDQTGAVGRIMLNGSYALHFPLGKNLEASLGVHGGFIQYRQNNSKLISEPDPDFPSPPIDPALQGDLSSSLIFDAAVGGFIRSEKFYIGFAASQFPQSKLSYSDVQFTTENQLFMHTYITGGYRFPIGKKDRVTFIPSATVKILKASPVSVDVNALFDFRVRDGDADPFRNIWIGLGYRQFDAIAGVLGFSISQMIDFNYSYDYPLTDIAAYQSGTHEFTLGFKLNNKDNSQNFNLFKKNE